MSLITRCPACSTLFKVVPDQLKISDGWVRCGHCSHVFDANLSLQDAAAVVPPPQPVDAAHEDPDPPYTFAPLPAQTHDEESPAEEMVVDGPTDVEPDHELDHELDDELEEPVPVVPADVDDAPSVETAMPLADAAVPPSPSEVPLAPLEDATTAPHDRREPWLDAGPASAALDSAAEPSLSDLSFIRKAERQARWSSPVMRALLALVALVAVLLLALQVALHERDRIVAAAPGSRGLMTQLCLRFNCKLAPLKRIDAIQIDSSSFSKLSGGAYRLNFVLRNGSSLPLALPAMELTLTDSRDQALLRRVIYPADFATGAAPILDAGAERASVLTVAVAEDVSGFTGYRLLAFYP